MSPASTSAMAPIIKECGNGQGWVECRRTSRTRSPASSSVSRATASSIGSPGSTNPASAECMPRGQVGWRPSTHASPRTGTMITTGSKRGKCSASQAAHSRFHPASTMCVAAPQLAQNLCRACHSKMLLAVPRIGRSSRGRMAPNERSSSKRPMLSSGPGSAMSMAKCAAPPASRPRNRSVASAGAMPARPCAPSHPSATFPPSSTTNGRCL